MRSKNTYLVAGSALFLIGLICTIYFEFYYPVTDFIIKIILRLILSIGTFLLFYQVSKNKFLKGLIFVLFSVFFSIFLWTTYEGDSWGSEFAVIGGGVPAGLVSGILFLICQYYFKLIENNIDGSVKKVLLYFLILLFTSIVVRNGGDWYYYIFEYR